MVGKVCVDRHCPDSYIETTEASLILAEKCQKVLRVLTCFDFDVSGIFQRGVVAKTLMTVKCGPHW